MFVEISGWCVNSGTGQRGLWTYAGYKTERKASKSLRSTPLNDISVQRFVITDAEPGKLGGEVDRVAREEVTMNTIKCTIDLPHCQQVTGTHSAVTRTKNVIFPSLKKCVMSRERIVGCWFGVSRHSSEARGHGFKYGGLDFVGFEGNLRNHGRDFLRG